MSEFRVLVRRFGTNDTLVYWLDQGMPALIGRPHFTKTVPAPDIVLDNDVVSRNHARLLVDANQDVIVEDLGSKNGTRIAGVKISGERHVLQLREQFQIGPFLLRVEPAGNDQTTATDAAGGGGRLSLDRDLLRILLDGAPLLEEVPELQYRLMDILDARAPAVVNRREIGDFIWGEGKWDEPMFDNLLHRLRENLKAAKPGTEKLIANSKGHGYRLQDR